MHVLCAEQQQEYLLNSCLALLNNMLFHLFNLNPVRVL